MDYKSRWLKNTTSNWDLALEITCRPLRDPFLPPSSGGHFTRTMKHVRWKVKKRGQPEWWPRRGEGKKEEEVGKKTLGFFLIMVVCRSGGSLLRALASREPVSRPRLSSVSGSGSDMSYHPLLFYHLRPHVWHMNQDFWFITQQSAVSSLDCR